MILHETTKQRLYQWRPGRVLRRLGLCSVMSMLVCGQDRAADAPKAYDLVVVGGTPGGICCAVSAAREGLNVLIVHQHQHLGGFMTSGCGGWEAPYDGARAPIYDEVLKRIAGYYRTKYGEASSQYLASIPDPKTTSRFGRPKVEPRVCELVFDQMIAAEPRITVLKGYFVEAVDRRGNLIATVTLREMNGAKTEVAAGKIFADCTYEGDLAAAAKVPYRVGRESRDEYHEEHAGIIFTELGPKKTYAPGQEPVNPFNLRLVGEQQRENGLLILKPESTGVADPSVMSYNYRLILTKDPNNRVMIEKPKNYDDQNFEASNHSILPGLPNDKVAWNGAGRLLGAQVGYPEADWKMREQISQRHLDAALSWLWFIQNDPAASPTEREFWKDYGLAKDEFPDNHNLPYEIYVREARRIVGRYVFTENDAVKKDGVERSLLHADSIAVTDWPFDSTACTAAVGPRGSQEGKLMAADVWCPAQVPFRTILPQGVDNLLVPVCLSASHVGWGTIRLEPVWMQTGEAAGLVAAMAIRAGVAPTQIDPDKLVKTLVKRGQMITFFNDADLASKAEWNPAVQYFGARGFFRSYDAKPVEPLTASLAASWISQFAGILAGQPDHWAVEDASGENVTMEDFCLQLKEAIRAREQGAESIDAYVSQRKLKEGAVVSRGEACALMFAILDKLEN